MSAYRRRQALVAGILVAQRKAERPETSLKADLAEGQQEKLLLVRLVHSQVARSWRGAAREILWSWKMSAAQSRFAQELDKLSSELWRSRECQQKLEAENDDLKREHQKKDEEMKELKSQLESIKVPEKVTVFQRCVILKSMCADGLRKQQCSNHFHWGSQQTCPRCTPHRLNDPRGSLFPLGTGVKRPPTPERGSKRPPTPERGVKRSQTPERSVKRPGSPGPTEAQRRLLERKKNRAVEANRNEALQKLREVMRQITKGATALHIDIWRTSVELEKQSMGSPETAAEESDIVKLNEKNKNKHEKPEQDGGSASAVEDSANSDKNPTQPAVDKNVESIKPEEEAVNNLAEGNIKNNDQEAVETNVSGVADGDRSDTQDTLDCIIAEEGLKAGPMVVTAVFPHPGPLGLTLEDGQPTSRLQVIVVTPPKAEHEVSATGDGEEAVRVGDVVVSVGGVSVVGLDKEAVQDVFGRAGRPLEVVLHRTQPAAQQAVDTKEKKARALAELQDLGTPVVQEPSVEESLEETAAIEQVLTQKNNELRDLQKQLLINSSSPEAEIWTKKVTN